MASFSGQDTCSIGALPGFESLRHYHERSVLVPPSRREQLAWAAGFFDGEGWIGHHTGGGYHISISQKGLNGVPFVFKRLRSIFRFGRISGPYGPNKNAYHFKIDNFEHVQAFVAEVWTWLGEVKRAQAINTLKRRSL